MDYLIFIDILGFGPLAGLIGEQIRIKPKAVREHFIHVIKNRIDQLKTEGLVRSEKLIKGSKYGDSDDWLLVVDNFNSACRVISRVLNHETDFLDFPKIPLEIAIGSAEYAKDANLDGSDLISEDSTIQFYKTEIVSRYHDWFKEENKGDFIKNTFILLTESAYQDLEHIDKKLGQGKILRAIGYIDNNENERHYYVADVNWLERRGGVFEFLDKIKIDQKDPPKLKYDRIDELYVAPAEYEEIEKTLAAEKAVLIIGPPELGKTYTAVRLLWEYYYYKGFEPVWREGRALADIADSGVKHKQIIYYEDPFGKGQYKHESELNRDLGVIFETVRNAKDTYLVITSRDEVFKEFERRSPEDHKKLEKKLRLQAPSYDDTQRKTLIMEWAEKENCRWLNHSYLKELVFNSAKDRKKLPTPLSIRDFAAVTSNIDTAGELETKIYEQSAGAENAFADEIRTMSCDKILFLAFPLLGLFRVSFAQALYEELVDNEDAKKKLKIKNAPKFDILKNWFADDKVEITRGRLKFSHPSYSGALRLLRNEEKLTTVFDVLIPAFVNALKNGEVERSRVAMALGRIGELVALEPLLEALEDTDSDVRYGAAEALGRIGAVKAVEPLIKALNDADSDVRYGAAGALRRIGKPAIDALAKTLTSQDSSVRLKVVDGLGTIGETAIMPLINTLKDDDNYLVRLRVAAALGRIGDERALDPLVKALKDDDKFVRYKAAEALGRIGDERALIPLAEAIKDVESDVQYAAATAFLQIQDAQKKVDS